MTRIAFSDEAWDELARRLADRRPPIGGIPPRTYADRQFDVARWTEFERGGHFPAVEQPEVLAADIRAAFRPLRVS